MKNTEPLEKSTDNFFDYLYLIFSEFKIPILTISSVLLVLYIITQIIEARKSKKERQVNLKRVQEIRNKHDLEQHFKNWLTAHVTHAKWRTLHESHHSFDAYFQGIYLQMIKQYKHETNNPQPDASFLKEMNVEIKKWLVEQNRVVFKKERRIG